MRRSQTWRRRNSETDALLLAMDWTVEDLDKPQVLVETSYGQSHPGSAHLLGLGEAVAAGVLEKGGKAALYHVSDMCDGVAQGTDGMSLSLFARELMASLLWTHGQCFPADAGVFVASCDKAIPAHLLAMARLDWPSIFVPGGVMLPGGGLPGVDRIWALDAQVRGGTSPSRRAEAARLTTCPTCGACQYMGTAGTMQVLAEAMGLALPGSALCPAPYSETGRLARMAGRQVLVLVERGLTARRLLTPQAFENALLCHAAVGGSANAVLHLPALARVVGVDLDLAAFEHAAARVPLLANIHAAGEHPSVYLWFAGGVPAVMDQMRELLHLDCLTVTGRTLGENLSRLRRSGYFERVRSHLDQLGLSWRQVIAPLDRPWAARGGLAVLRGNLCPEGAVAKPHSAPGLARGLVGPARVFDNEDAALRAVRDRGIDRGTVVVVRFQGPRARGMPELFRVVDALNNRPDLAISCAILTDGRFSGATRGPAVGYMCPEAAIGGPLAFIQDGDLVRLDVEGGSLDVVDAGGRPLEAAELLGRRPVDAGAHAQSEGRSGEDEGRDAPQEPANEGTGRVPSEPLFDLYRATAGLSVRGAQAGAIRGGEHR